MEFDNFFMRINEFLKMQKQSSELILRGSELTMQGCKISEQSAIMFFEMKFEDTND